MGKIISAICAHCGAGFHRDSERNKQFYCGTVCRFLSKIKIMPSGCWEWTAGKTAAGYPMFRADEKLIYGHRFSYEHFIRKIPAGLLICHKCDNPGCVNPHHFFVGTQADNVNDCIKKGRQLRDENGRVIKLLGAGHG